MSLLTLRLYGFLERSSVVADSEMPKGNEAIAIYTQQARGQQWLEQYRGRRPIFACILGFTATALIPGISAAGATPEDRKYTAIADAEFLVNGVTQNPQYPLPPLDAGLSPVLISRAAVEALDLPVYLFNAGLPQSPAVPAIDLGGISANCVTSGNALPLATVKHLFEQGLRWGETLGAIASDSYLIIAECVVGGTTTALSILTGLGFAASGKVNSSHPSCNHAQKWKIVQTGLQRAGVGARDWRLGTREDSTDVASRPSQSSSTSPQPLTPSASCDPLKLVAAVGDPMQIVAAGMTIAASSRSGVLLAGGTQMLAVYALTRALAQQDMPLALAAGIDEQYSQAWNPARIAVGTTRWVAEDPTADTIGLAREIGDVPLLATRLNFATSRYPQLQAYERGYVKEGVGAGGCAIAAHLCKGWNSMQLLQVIEALVEQCYPK